MPSFANKIIQGKCLFEKVSRIEITKIKIWIPIIKKIGTNPVLNHTITEAVQLPDPFYLNEAKDFVLSFCKNETTYNTGTWYRYNNSGKICSLRMSLKVFYKFINVTNYD